LTKRNRVRGGQIVRICLGVLERGGEKRLLTGDNPEGKMRKIKVATVNGPDAKDAGVIHLPVLTSLKISWGGCRRMTTHGESRGEGRAQTRQRFACFKSTK